jgi:uncharacterized protein (TIGR00251 family)
MIAITDHPDGCILPVRAQPGARREGIVGEQAGALKVAVNAPAQEGRANKAVSEVLREALGLKRSKVDLVAGATSRDKRFLIHGLSKSELQERLDQAAKGKS